MPPSLKVFVVLMSPRGAGGLTPQQGNAWPSWLCPDGVLRHVTLEMPRSFLKVTRWNLERDEPAPDGKHWHIVSAPGAAVGLPREGRAVEPVDRLSGPAT